ncbi:helix-turn-helix domain-containing protein [Thioflexithrix psekupsensis]|uniref:HTH cro/C1-type domain-containing protein n=1 Tax=Thioflexithrix psekupsensis TaxID=1570016 RepID=A0A251XDD7_9GAMM|nr:helix-turn-helix transcriptional regulator [Thioflexithrix psekupsensis]OUD16230.1 hypothetical protein TPSD3_00455 [Thioflexithrix psekupsensis]
MQLHEKIKFFRRTKGFTQEEIAEKLNITPVAYSNLERGESNISMKRLEEITKAIDIELLDLLSFGEKNVIVLHADTYNSSNSFLQFLQNVNIPENFNVRSIELEKANLLIEQQNEQIDLLRQDIEHLKEIIQLLKQQLSNKSE